MEFSVHLISEGIIIMLMAVLVKLVVDVRNALQKINGRVIGVETWAKMHEKEDERRLTALERQGG